MSDILVAPMALDSCLKNDYCEKTLQCYLPVMSGYRVNRVAAVLSELHPEYVVAGNFVSLESSQQFGTFAREHGAAHQLNMAAELGICRRHLEVSADVAEGGSLTRGVDG